MWSKLGVSRKYMLIFQILEYGRAQPNFAEGYDEDSEDETMYCAIVDAIRCGYF